MQNQQLSDVKGKELVAAGHAFAKAIGMDTPMIEIAKMVSELAGRLDCALVRGDELEKQRDALASENATIKTMNDILSEELRGYESDGAFDGPIAHKLWHSSSETPATDAYLNSVRAEGIEILTGKLQQLIDEGVFDAKEIGVAAGAVHEGAQIAAQLRAGKDGE